MLLAWTIFIASLGLGGDLPSHLSDFMRWL